MTDKSKHQLSIGISIIGILLAAGAFSPALFSLFFHGEQLDSASKQAEVIVGFLFLAITCAFIVIVQQAECTKHLQSKFADLESLNTTNKLEIESSLSKEAQVITTSVEGKLSETNIVSAANKEELKTSMHNQLSAVHRFLDFHTYLSEESWGRKTFDGMVSLLKEVDSNVHVKPVLRSSIDDFFMTLALRVRSPWPREEYPKANESERMRRLKTFVSNARVYVYAVTYDENDYIQQFWSGALSAEYLLANEGNPTKINRVFVVGREVINGQDKEKQSIVDRVVKEHIKANLSIRIICKDRLPLSWKDHCTSFLVCDDNVVSKSYSIDEGTEIPGYVLINDRNHSRQVKNLFEDLDSVITETLVQE